MAKKEPVLTTTELAAIRRLGAACGAAMADYARETGQAIRLERRLGNGKHEVIILEPGEATE